jgi:hypothetical protein
LWVYGWALVDTVMNGGDGYGGYGECDGWVELGAGE